MQIVIDIDEERYNQIKRCADNYLVSGLELAVKNGTPLPKGHGDLIDANSIYFRLNEAQIEGTSEYKGLGEAKQIVFEAPIIIKAESEG
jgi:hypothetical protein